MGVSDYCVCVCVWGGGGGGGGGVTKWEVVEGRGSKRLCSLSSS